MTNRLVYSRKKNEHEAVMNFAKTVLISIILLTSNLSLSAIVGEKPLIPLAISGFLPASGTMGAIVTITGTDFDTTPAGNIVKLNDLQAYVINATSTQLQVTIPEGAYSGKFSVTVNGSSVESSANFTVLDFANLFTVRGLYVQFDDRAVSWGYYTGQVIHVLNNSQPSLGHTVAEEVNLQLDEMKKIGVNTIVLEIRTTTPGWTGGFEYPDCNLHEVLGFAYPFPAGQEIANLRTLFDLIHN